MCVKATRQMNPWRSWIGFASVRAWLLSMAVLALLLLFAALLALPIPAPMRPAARHT